MQEGIESLIWNKTSWFSLHFVASLCYDAFIKANLIGVVIILLLIIQTIEIQRISRIEFFDGPRRLKSSMQKSVTEDSGGFHKKMEKLHFRVKIGVRFKIKLKIVFKTINFIYSENLGLLGLFWSKIE